MTNIEALTTAIGEFVVTYGIKLIGAVVALVIGLWVINIIVKQLTKLMNKRGVDASLVPFLRSVLSMLLKVALFISIAGMVGIEMTSFIAILGAAGLAVGLALQGTLQNFAGGVIILLLKPFKVGDVIEAQGFNGVIKEIQIFHTIMNTFDNKVIIIPNGSLANSSLTNFNKLDTRRVDWTIGIDYADDFEKAKKLIRDILESDERILPDPTPFVRLSELADSSVNITAKAWVKTPDFWDVKWDVLEKVKSTFDKEGVSFPFPQMDVHLDK